MKKRAQRGRDCNPCIPNPGMGDALITGFRDMKNAKKCPNFTLHLPEKYLFPEFLGQFDPAL